MIDAANPVVFVAAEAVGLRGAETVNELEARPAVLAILEELRRQAAVAMGLCDRREDAPLSNPKVAIIAPPTTYITLDGTVVDANDFDISVRTISSGQVHRAIPVTAALCTAVAQKLQGTLVADMAAGTGSALRIGSPSGVFAADADVDSSVVAREVHRFTAPADVSCRAVCPTFSDGNLPSGVAGCEVAAILRPSRR